MPAERIFESIPNFSEGRRVDVVADITAAAAPAFVLDADPDADHNRAVITLAGGGRRLVEGLLGAIGLAAARIDLRAHQGVHPRVGAADVVPIVPLGEATVDECHELAREIGTRVWDELKIPVFFYGEREGRTLADIRAGRARPDVGGPAPHPTAGAVCVGARRPLVAFNVILYGFDLVAARGLARSIRESGAGLRGVQALAFELSGGRVQLSMNLFRIEETGPADVIAELTARGVPIGAEQVVGLCPARVATASADGRILEGRLASAAAGALAGRCEERGGEEHLALAGRFRRESGSLGALTAAQDDLLTGSERAAAMVAVADAARVADGEATAMLAAAGRGLRAAVSAATAAVYRARVDALDARLA